MLQILKRIDLKPAYLGFTFGFYLFGFGSPVVVLWAVSSMSKVVLETPGSNLTVPFADFSNILQLALWLCLQPAVACSVGTAFLVKYLSNRKKRGFIK